MRLPILACATGLLVLGSVGCDRQERAPARAAPAPQSSSAPELLLYCGAGIRPPVEDLIHMFANRHAVKIVTDFAGSQMLLSKIKVSGLGDLYIPGDRLYIDQAAAAGLLRSHRRVAYFVPTLLVQQGNPKKIRGLPDLIRPGVKLGLGNPEACAIGRISRRLLATNNLARELVEKNLAFQSMTVNELGLQIQSRSLDVVIVWDAIARYYQDHGEEVPIPAEHNIISTVEVAVLACTKHLQLAEGFVAFATSAEGQAVFQRHLYRIDPPK